jgi:hypothetical protein
MSTPIPPYGVAIQDAIASGDLGKMQSVAADAEKYLQEFGEIGDGLKKLKDEIGRHGGGQSQVAAPLYAVTIRSAIASNDLEKMKEVAAQAESMLQQADAVRSALSELQGKLGGDRGGNG